MKEADYGSKGPLPSLSTDLSKWRPTVREIRPGDRLGTYTRGCWGAGVGANTVRLERLV